MPPHATATDDRLAAIFARYAGQPGDMIPILQDVQAVFGYLHRDAMSATARFLNLPEVAVYEVATFYTQFHLTRQGEHRIKVCQGTACHVRGAGRVMEAVRKKLGIKPGETTEDFQFSLERVACFGSCALAPVMVVDGKVYGGMSPQKALELLEKLE